MLSKIILRKPKLKRWRRMLLVKVDKKGMERIAPRQHKIYQFPARSSVRVAARGGARTTCKDNKGEVLIQIDDSDNELNAFPVQLSTNNVDVAKAGCSSSSLP
ncbi:hypothetical protein AMTRI_Chr13g119460 [Amborella trichopoda]